MSANFSTSAGNTKAVDFFPNTAAFPARVATIANLAFITWKLLSFQPGFLARTLQNSRDCMSLGARPSTNWGEITK